MMTRSQRNIRSRYATKRFESVGNKKEVEEVYSVKSSPPKNTLLVNMQKTNRCTFFRPSITDFSQLTEAQKPTDNYQNILREQFGLEPPVRDPPLSPRDASVICDKVKTATNYSQYAEQVDKSPSITADLEWQPVEHADDLERYIGLKDVEVPNAAQDISEPRVRIAPAPRVRVIAEKFSKFKRNDVELRKLEEKVVCLEYDVFDTDGDGAEPFQKMRAYFAIKPRKIKENVNDTIVIPPDVKQTFNIQDGDLNKLNKQEIEIIDGKIPDNRSLLEDLKKVLRRKQAIQNKKKQGTLDLEYLYQMAKSENPPLDEDYSNTNMLSKAELDEIKDLIIKKCTSSVHGIRRKTVKSEYDSIGSACYISKCLASELMREVDMENT